MKIYKIILIVIFANICAKSYGQSLIAGIPSADVVGKNHLELTHESQINTWKNPDKFYWSGFNFLTYGLGNGLEIGVMAINLTNQNMDNLTTGFGFKKVHQIFKNSWEKGEVKLTFGQSVLFSLQKPEVGGWAYSHASFRMPILKTRLTGGLTYGSPLFFGMPTVTNSDGTKLEVDKAVLSAMFGFEQPISKKFSIIADWYSGSHDLAALITAFQWNIGHQTLIVGYKTKNNLPMRDGFIITELMIHF
jgi:hypothetical protein